MEEDERKMIPHWSLSYYALLLQSVEWDGKDNEHSIIYLKLREVASVCASLQLLDID